MTHSQNPQIFFENIEYRDFPGDPVVKSPCSQCRGLRFNPQETKIPHFKVPPKKMQSCALTYIKEKKKKEYQAPATCQALG